MRITTASSLKIKDLVREFEEYAVVVLPTTRVCADNISKNLPANISHLTAYSYVKNEWVEYIYSSEKLNESGMSLIEMQEKVIKYYEDENKEE